MFICICICDSLYYVLAVLIIFAILSALFMNYFHFCFIFRFKITSVGITESYLRFRIGRITFYIQDYLINNLLNCGLYFMGRTVEPSQKWSTRRSLVMDHFWKKFMAVCTPTLMRTISFPTDLFSITTLHVMCRVKWTTIIWSPGAHTIHMKLPMCARHSHCWCLLYRKQNTYLQLILLCQGCLKC